MRSRSRSGGTAVTPSSHRGGTPALQLWLCLFHLVPSCSLENQHIQHFKNLPKPDNQPPAVSRSNHCPLLVVLPALCIQAFVITAASQSKHGPMGPPFSILLGLEKISSGQFHSAADLRMLLDCRNCTACTKGGHWKPPTLTACHWGGSLPPARAVKDKTPKLQGREYENIYHKTINIKKSSYILALDQLNRGFRASPCMIVIPWFSSAFPINQHMCTTFW